MSEPFDIERGVLQGDIFSPVSFIAGLDRIFRRHDISNSDVTVGTGENTVCVSRLEYADDSALIDENVDRHLHVSHQLRRGLWKRPQWLFRSERAR